MMALEPTLIGRICFWRYPLGLIPGMRLRPMPEVKRQKAVLDELLLSWPVGRLRGEFWQDCRSSRKAAVS